MICVTDLHNGTVSFVELFFVHTIQFGNAGFLYPLFSSISMVVCRYICLCCLKNVYRVKGAGSVIWFHLFSISKEIFLCYKY